MESKKSKKEASSTATTTIEVPQAVPVNTNAPVVAPAPETTTTTQAQDAASKMEIEDLSKVYEEAYYDYDPDVDFGEGFTQDLLQKIADAGKNNLKELVVTQTPDYTNWMGMYYYPSEEKYRKLRRWLKHKKLNADFALSHSTLNVFTSSKSLQLKIFFEIRRTL